MENQPSKKQNKTDKNSYSSIVRYAGLAFQMMAILGLAVFAGYKLDQKIGWRFPLFLVIFSLLGLAILLWQIIKDTRK
ncbi:AtpZ/AtpI family protein [Chitinophaga sp. Cy-1792]|uniref:AtpZ/AtpI family protein n=1 Tax=Chitinophaga sp. Cy-1792 TaxID=2608339 RepID=UPI00196611BD|nr:AtpZ/AtpI family protein [Chitinophaga sp. Cy-1792]